MVAVINQSIQRLLAHFAILIPSRLGEPARVTVRDLTTGYRLFEGTFDPPAEGEVRVLPPDSFGDHEPPYPTSGGPLRFFTITARPDLELALGEGLEAAATASTLSVRGEAGATHGSVEVRLLGLDDTAQGSATSSADGAFSVSVPAVAGHRYVLAIAAEVGVQEPLEIGFNEALDPAFTGIEVADVGASTSTLHPVVTEPVGSSERVRVRPERGWVAGRSYELRLTSQLRDAKGNEWGRQLNLRFRAAKSEVLSGLRLERVRDVARLGSLLFVAAESQGLVVVDGSNPGSLKSYLPAGAAPEAIGFTFPLADPVRGVAVDPHGRVLVAGGGVNNFGQLKVFDPLRLERTQTAASQATNVFRGSTIISDQLGAAGGTQLPEGTPRRLAVLSQDRKSRWTVGEAGVPDNLQVQPATPPPGGASHQLTVSGTAATPRAPVTLRDLDRGTWARVDAGLDGTFTLSLQVEAGDRLELLRNDESYAYVTVQGAGIAIVDVNAFYDENDTAGSAVLGYYTGYGDGLELCDQPVSDISTALLDLAALWDPAKTGHELSVLGLVGFRGLLMLSTSNDATALRKAAESCALFGGTNNVISLDVLQDVALLGRPAGQERDWALVTHRQAGLLVYDVSDRTNLVLVSRIQLPDQPSYVAVDRSTRRAYVSTFSGKLFVVDLASAGSTQLVDRNSDGRDDRILEEVPLQGITNSPLMLVPELGIAFAGGLESGEAEEGGTTAISVGGPRLAAVASSRDAAGVWRRREVARLAPFGVPTAPEGSGASAPKLSGTFRVYAGLPGWLGEELRLDVESVGPGGLRIAAAGDSEQLDGLPRVALTGEDGLLLRRQSAEPHQDGYNLYVSEEVAALADLRAARDYTRTEDEDAASLCPRCDQAEEGAAADARELLSGESIRVRLPQELRRRLMGTASTGLPSQNYTAAQLEGATLDVASVRWELSPAIRQEPTLNPSYGTGDVAPGTLLHSGEMSLEAVDLYVKGRGFDFALSRTYRSQTVGAGPLGPGWELGYGERLRELPNGDVEYFDGRGRRETFRKRQNPSAAESAYAAPAGRFVELSRTSAGWVIIGPYRDKSRFDRFGRLISIADAVKDSAETGNEMRFTYDAASRLVDVEDSLERHYGLGYDAAGRLVSVEDFDGRKVKYAYDEAGRLATVTSPPIQKGESKFPGGLETIYDYESVTGDLANLLNRRDNLSGVTDSDHRSWLAQSYADADGDGRSDEMTGQTWGGHELTIAYDFAAGSATVTDRRGNPWNYVYDAQGHLTAITDPVGAQTTTGYDSEGLLTTVTDPRGIVTTNVYDTEGNRRSRGNLTSTTIASGPGGPNGSPVSLITNIDYDTRTNQPAVVTEPGGAVTTIERDAAGLPTAIARSEGALTSLTYNPYGQPVTIAETGRPAITLRYFESGPQRGYLHEEVADSGGLGLVTTFGVDDRGNVTSITQSTGVVRTSSYNELDWIVEEAVTGAGVSYTTARLYDAAGNAMQVRESLGGSSVLTTKNHGLLGEVQSIARAASGLPVTNTTLSYDANFNIVRMVDASGMVTESVYDTANRVVSRTFGAGTPDAITESFGYDTAGRLVSRSDGRGGSWRQEFDGHGRLAATIDPLNNRRERSYDARDNTVELRFLDAAGTLLSRSSTEYDRLDRPTVQTQWLWTDDPDAATAVETRTTYDAAGNVRSVTDPLGRTMRFEYDAAGRLVAQVDAAGNRLDYELNDAGLPVETTLTERLPGGGTTATTSTNVYDQLGRLIEARDALGNTTRWTRDAHGNPSSTIDAEGNVTTREYDALGRLLSVTRPGGLRVETGYDASGNRTSYTDALGNTTTWDYDVLARLAMVTYADGTSEGYEYDAAGNLVLVTDGAGTEVVQGFDAAGRLVSRAVTLAAGVEGPTAESYVYDGLGRTLQATSGSVVTVRSYDSLSRMRSETTNGRTVAFEFDPAGNVTTLRYPSAFVVQRTVDELDRLASIPGVATYGYRGPALIAERSVGALSASTIFDAVRRPLQARVEGAIGRVLDERLAWSPRSLKVATVRRDVGKGWTLELDGAGRLLGADSTLEVPANNSVPGSGPAATAFSFAYDTADNLLSRGERRFGIESTVPLPLDASGRNRPAAIADQGLTWSPQGNLTGKGDLRFRYDYRNRLTRVTRADGTELARYVYDAYNRRVGKTAGGVNEELVWDGWQLIERYQGGNLVERRTYGARQEEVVRLERDLDGGGALEQTYTPVYDHTASMALIADPTGRVVERYRYTPYGERTVLVDATPPAVEQLRVAGGDLWLEISEGVDAEALQEAVAAGALTLTNTGSGTSLSVTATQPVRDGRQAFRRTVIAPTPAPAIGTQLQLRVEPTAVVDFFGNQLASTYVRSFAWPAADAVLDDAAPPRIEGVRLLGRRVEVELSEEPDLGTVATAITAGGGGLDWTLGEDRYTLRTTEPLPPGAATLVVDASLADLSGSVLVAGRADAIAASEQDRVVFEALDLRESGASTVGNVAGFHGHDHEEGLGLIYARNRWLDPEMGRFVSTDPLGYVDGPNLYAFAGNNPSSFGDPLGLALYAFDGTWNDRDKMTNDTNVAKLADAYRGLAYYYVGVGTAGRINKFGCGLTGCGARNRIGAASADLERAWNAPWDGGGSVERLWGQGVRDIDLIGFSRGAATARAFASVIARRGVLNRRTGKREVPAIRFLGVFDTVPSFGIPGNSVDIGYDFQLPSNVMVARHAIAGNEYRGTFPLMAINDESACGPDPRVLEQVFEGAHSDVGGGYDDDDSLARIPLRWMWNEMRVAGLPMGELTAKDAAIGGDLTLHKSHESLIYLPTWIRVKRAQARGDLSKVRKVYYPACPQR
jgi:RHS repeat-associated protein